MGIRFLTILHRGLASRMGNLQATLQPCKVAEGFHRALLRETFEEVDLIVNAFARPKAKIVLP